MAVFVLQSATAAAPESTLIHPDFLYEMEELPSL